MPNSAENAEKVVNPPKNPDIQKYFTLSDGDQCKDTIAVNRPMMKHPRTLINNVGIGILNMVVGNSLLRNKRVIDPNAPPNPVAM